jgi:hypothetical protein
VSFGWFDLYPFIFWHTRKAIPCIIIMNENWEEYAIDSHNYDPIRFYQKPRYTGDSLRNSGLSRVIADEYRRSDRTIGRQHTSNVQRSFWRNCSDKKPETGTASWPWISHRFTTLHNMNSYWSENAFSADIEIRNNDKFQGEASHTQNQLKTIFDHPQPSHRPTRNKYDLAKEFKCQF